MAIAVVPKGVSFNRRAVAEKGMLMSLDARVRGDMDLLSPICIYTLSETLGVIVRFNEINMEGMYDSGPQPRIHLSALRPVPRRAFNCAHELGHHLFGHGSTIDELTDDHVATKTQSPDEFLVNVFASFVLMPTLGLRRAFGLRGTTPNTASPEHILAIASDFGVGYSTVVNHLAYGIREMATHRVAPLLKAQRSLRQEIVGSRGGPRVVVVDSHSQAQAFDAEVGTLFALPDNFDVEGSSLAVEDKLGRYALFRATRPGIAQIGLANGSWSAFVRISKFQYVGLARYRHLEDADDD